MTRKTTRDGRRERSEHTRERILEASAVLFGDLGYAATTLERIASDAGIHKALVGYHFGNKQGLYQALFRNAIAAGKDLLAPVRELEGRATNRLDAYVDALGRLFEAQPHFARTIVREWMSGGAHVDQDVLSEFMHFFHVDQEILDAGVRAGELRETDPHATHLALVGSLVFFEITRPLRDGTQGERIPLIATDTFRSLVKDLLRRGLAP